MGFPVYALPQLWMCQLLTMRLSLNSRSTHFSSVIQLCSTLCDPKDCSTPGFPVHHQLPELAQTHVHQVSDAIQPSHPLSSPSPPALNLSQHQGLFQWVSSSHQLAKVLEFQLQHQSFQWTFRTDFLYKWLVWSYSPKDFQSSNASILQHSAFFIVQLSHPYMTPGKTLALVRRTFVGKVMSRLFNKLSRLVMFPFKEQASFNFMAWVPSALISGAPKNKGCHCFHCFPIYLPWSDGTECYDLTFLNVEF